MPEVGYTFNSLIESLSGIGSTSSNYADLALTGSQARVVPAVDYGRWSNHVFFADAIRKFRNSLSRIENIYPIGLSGGDVSSLCAENVYKVDQWKKESSGFDLWLLDQLSLTSSITASSTNQLGETVNLTYIIRDQSNTITGSQTATVNSISASAHNFEEQNYEIVPHSAGSANDHYAWAGTAESYVTRTPKFRNMLPEVLFYNDENYLLEKTLQAFADSLDEIKSFVDQMSYLKHTSYEDHDRTPNKFLPVLANHFGINLYQSAVNAALSSFLMQSSTAVTTQDIAYSIWNRIVNNLAYILKNKGTRECLEAIGRMYGVDHNFLKVDEYTILERDRRIKVPEEVDVPTLFSTGDVYVQMPTGSVSALDFDGSRDFTIEIRVSVTSATEHILLQHPLYQIKLDASGQAHFEVEAGTTASTVQSSISSFIQKKDNFIHVIASRTGDNLKIWTMGLSGSGSGGDDIVMLASAVTTGVQAVNFDSSGGSASFGAYFPGSGSFNGYIHEVRSWTVPLEEEDLKEHVRNFESISFINSTASNGAGYGSLSAHWKLKEDIILTGGYNYIIDSTTAGNTANPINFENQSTKRYKVFTNQQKFSHWYPSALFIDNDKVRQSTDDEKFLDDPGDISIHLTPINAVNRDIRNCIQDVNIKHMLGDPEALYEDSYSGSLQNTLQDVTTRYNGKDIAEINTFVDAMDNFNDVLGGIFEFMEQFIPAKSNILSKGLLVEPHILERPKIRRKEYDLVEQQAVSAKINTHYLEFDSTAASGTTTASFEGYKYNNGVQEFIKDTITSQAIVPLSNKDNDSINVPRFSATRVGRFIPVKILPSTPSATEVSITLSRRLISPTASSSATNGYIDGTVKMLRAGKSFKTDQPAIKFEFPSSSDGTNYFVAEVGDIDNGKGRVISGKDNLFTSKLDEDDIQIKLQLSELVKSATSDPNTLSGEIGVVDFVVTNLFSNASQVVRLAIGNRDELYNEFGGQGGTTIQS